MTRHKKIEQLGMVIVQSIKEVNKAYPCYGLESYCEPNARDEKHLNEILKISNVFAHYLHSIYHLARREKSLKCFNELRELGREIEAEVNYMNNDQSIFKGLIFNFGIICYSLFYIYLKKIDWQEFPKVVKILVNDIQYDFKEMEKYKFSATNGELCYLRDNISGARGSAIQGYEFLNEGLNYYHHFKETSDYYDDIIDFIMLNFFMSKIDDTSILRNNSLYYLKMTQNTTRKWMKEIIENDDKTISEMLCLNTKWRLLRIMPNGSRDMLICLKFLYDAIRILDLRE